MQQDLTKNYFELFGLPAHFDLDTADLASRYRDLQRRFHPDRYASAPDQERRLAMQFTAEINGAYQTLKNPLQRGRYLLTLAGVDLGDETDTTMDPAFLMEQMELREALEDLRHSADSVQRLLQMGDDLQQRIALCVARLREQLALGSEEGYQQARNSLRELQFLEKLGREIEQLEEDLI